MRNFKFDGFSQIHIYPILNEIILTVQAIIKVLLLTHNYLHHNRSEYLSYLISIHTHNTYSFYLF